MQICLFTAIVKNRRIFAEKRLFFNNSDNISSRVNEKVIPAYQIRFIAAHLMSTPLPDEQCCLLYNP